MSSNSLCDHLRGQTNQTPATWLSNFVNHSYDYRLNWTPLSPVTMDYLFFLQAPHSPRQNQFILGQLSPRKV